MSCGDDHRRGAAAGAGGGDDSRPGGCSGLHPTADNQLPRFQISSSTSSSPGDHHGWSNLLPFMANGSAMDGKASCCLGIPQCLLSIPPPTSAAPPLPPHCVLDGSSSMNSSSIKQQQQQQQQRQQQQQQQQQPVWFYSKLSQLQFLTRLFHNNLLGNFICDESFHHGQMPGSGNFPAGNIHQNPAAGGIRHCMAHPTSAPENLFLHLQPLPPPPPQCSRFPTFQVPAACSSSAKLVPQQPNGACDHQATRCSRTGEESLTPNPTPGTDTCLLCQARPPVDVPMLANLSAQQQLLPAIGFPVLQTKPQFPSAPPSSQQWTTPHRNESFLPARMRPPFPGAADNTNTISSTTGLFGEQSAAAAAGHGDLSSPQSSNISQLCGPLQDVRSGHQMRNRVKGQWSLAEDKSLVKLVKQYGTRRWSLIATFMANRSGKQCRERWVNHLQPDIRKEGWTKEEEELLVQAHSYFGNKWSAIAKMLPGRTDNSIKNHWHAALRKKDRHGKLRSNLLREYIQQKMAKADSPGSQEETTTTVQELAQQSSSEVRKNHAVQRN